MPFTYTPQNVIDLVREFAHGIPVSAIDSQVVDIISSGIYMSRPWRWTIQQISPSITLVDNTQDYNAPTNIYRLTRAFFRRTDITPNQVSLLDVREQIFPEYQKRSHLTIGTIAIDYPSGQLRLEAPPAISGSMVVVLEGDYQPHPTKITDATLGVNFWFPDQYFPVIVEGVKWKIYQLSDDSRAGNVVVDRSGRRQYTGQLSIFMSQLAAMEEAEDFGSGAPGFVPDLSLGSQIRGTDVTAYGWR